MLFIQRENLFKCLVSFLFLHKPPENKSIVNLYQKVLLGYFSEDIKMWPSLNVLNLKTSNWVLYNIYVDSMGLYANVNSLLL